MDLELFDVIKKMLRNNSTYGFVGDNGSASTTIVNIIEDKVLSYYTDVYVEFATKLKNLFYQYNAFIQKEDQYIASLRIMHGHLKKELFDNI